MLCPNCGYLVTRKQGSCPKCKQPLPDTPGEWSDESSIDRRIPEKIIKETRPPDQPIEVKKEAEKVPPEKPQPKEKVPTEKTAPVKEKPKADENSAPGPLFKKEKPVELQPEVIEKPKVAPKPEAVPKPEAATKPVVEPKPDLTPKAEPAPKPTKATLEVQRDEKPKVAQPIKTEKHEERLTTPEPYKTDSATSSSEFSTDWIEKYARTHVSPIPERAGLGIRFWAGLLDWMLLAAVGVIVLLAGRLMITLLNGASYSPWELLRILSLPVGGVWIVLVILYFTVFVAATGQTPGAIVMDIRVTDASTNRPLSTGKSFIRALVFIFSVAVLGAGFWAAIFDPTRRTWPDKVAGTRVNPVIKM